MAEWFLDLPVEERREILEDRAVRLARTPNVLEKDVWVCWVLERLVAAPMRKPMVFKGGTSLSKAHHLIARFSDDVDITLDCRSLVTPFDPFSAGVSKTSIRRYAKQLEAAMARHVESVIVPWFVAARREPAASTLAVEHDGFGALRIGYESALPPETGYVRRSVLVEFGGRNSLQPSDARVVVPYLAAATAGLEFPSPTVDVLRPERTFWEKAILIHWECCSSDFRSTRDRSARHWYDMACMADHGVGRAALESRHLLEEVVRFNRVFHPSRVTDYSECLTGGLRLVPTAGMARTLRADYRAMEQEGMFDGEAPPFDDVVSRLEVLEKFING